jgi:hypothetical protein
VKKEGLKSDFSKIKFPVEFINPYEEDMEETEEEEQVVRVTKFFM